MGLSENRPIVAKQEREGKEIMNTRPVQKETDVFENLRDPATLKPLILPQSAEVLSESEAAARTLFEFSPHPMWVTDCDTFRFLLVNDAAIEHYGYSQDELLSMTLQDIFPAEDFPFLVQSRTASLPEKGKLGVWRHIKRNGEIIHVEITARDFCFQGKSARLAMANDITDRLKTEQALRQSEREQRQLAERLERERERLVTAQTIAKIGSWEFDLTKNLLTWSEETYRIFGIDRNAFEGSEEAFLELVHPADRAAVHHAYTESVANHTPYAINHRMLMGDGSIKIVYERCQTLYDAGGRPIRSIGTVQDITDQQQTEQALHQILEGAHCLLWTAEIEDVVDRPFHWKIQFASEQAAQRSIPLSLTDGMSYGDAWHHARPIEDQERTDRYGEQEIRAGRSYQQEFRCYSKDGALHWLSENVHVEAVGEGKWRCF